MEEFASCFPNFISVDYDLENRLSPSSFNAALSFQWCVEFPRNGAVRRSPAFDIRGTEFCFQLTREDLYAVRLRPVEKVWPKDFQPVSITTLALFDENSMGGAGVSNFKIRNSKAGRPLLFDEAPLVWSVQFQEVRECNTIADLSLLRLIFLLYDVPAVSVQPPKPVTETKSVQVDTPSLYPDIDDFLNFSNILKSSAFADVQLKCDGGTLYAHKVVLAGWSEVFGRMFEADAAEPSSPVDVVEMTGADISSVRLLLQILYGGEIGDLSMEMAYPLYKLAKEYQITPLKNMCSDFMMKRLDEEKS